MTTITPTDVIREHPYIECRMCGADCSGNVEEIIEIDGNSGDVIVRVEVFCKSCGTRDTVTPPKLLPAAFPLLQDHTTSGCVEEAQVHIRVMCKRVKRKRRGKYGLPQLLPR